MTLETIVIIICCITSLEVLLILIKYFFELRKEKQELKETAEVAYNLDPDFKIYVDKYMNKHNLTLEETLESKMVKLYLNYLKQRDE